MSGSHTELLLRALHLCLQVLAVGCCLLLQLLVLLGCLWEPGKGEGDKCGHYRRDKQVVLVLGSQQGLQQGLT